MPLSQKWRIWLGDTRVGSIGEGHHTTVAVGLAPALWGLLRTNHQGGTAAVAAISLAQLVA